MSHDPVLNRSRFVKTLKEQAQWDVVIIGGGATGLGIAVDSASRGYKTALLEGADFAKGTSSRSTKLVHGGVRYLAQGDIGLVYEALSERGLLLKNAPHLVKQQSFVIPCYSLFSKLKFLIGLKLYDWLSGKASFGASRLLNRSDVSAAFPGLKTDGLLGGIEYFDGQFDDARLAINLAQTAAEKGATLLNYFNVVGLQKENGRIAGVFAVDGETGNEYSLKAKAVVNATGVFVDDILQMDKPEKAPLVRPSQGVHLVIDQSFLGSDKAMMIPETPDGRVLFAVPWHNRVLVGTTDTPLQKHSVEPVASEEEIAFIIATLNTYLAKPLGRRDVQSVFAGLRPLAAPQRGSSKTKEISRSHKVIISDSGLLSITGGKWTTYRKMAEDAVNKASEIGGLASMPCSTRNIPIHGSNRGSEGEPSIYGTDCPFLMQLISEAPSLQTFIAPGFPYTEAEVIWAVRAEMARTVEDVLARRLRLLFLNANAAIAAAPRVAELMAAELGYNRQWQEDQITSFTKLAQAYTGVPTAQNNYETLPEVSNLSA